MKKIVFSVLMIFLCSTSVFSQFDVQLSQYMFHNSAFNPAAVGEDEMIQVTGQYRLQWVGMPNAGKTLLFSINSPLKIGSTLNGVGFKAFKDEVGLFTNTSYLLQYAYKKRMGAGVLSLGADIGVVGLGFHGDSTYLPESEFHDKADMQIPKTSVTGNSLDLNVGLFYSTPKYYAGLSYSHLNNPTVSWTDNIDFAMAGTMYFTGGYNWTLPDSKYVLKPTTLIKTDFTSFQWDASARLEYDNKYWGGLSYRIQDAVVIMAGINISGGLSIGYSYDLPTTQIITVSSGSHEILMVYSFEYVFGKKKNKFKSIRIL
ncbi:MAG: PorP/SprF family type IX secretion system membrane protein [Paludibacter sp.]